MKERFNDTINSIIISSVLVLILGIIMIVFPKISIETIGIMIATYIIIHGVVLIYLDVKATKYYVPFDGLITGILSILLGIVLLCKPSILQVVFAFVVGIWMVLTSINNIKIAVKLSKTKLPWLFILIFGILDLIVGIIVIFNPFEATISLTLFAGIMLIVHSFINIVNMLIIKKDVNEISKEISTILKNAEK